MLSDMIESAIPSSIFVDAGANIGNPTLCIAAVADDLVDAITHSVRTNGLTERVHVHQQGLGDRETTAELVSGPTSNLGE